MARPIQNHSARYITRTAAPSAETYSLMVPRKRSSGSLHLRCKSARFSALNTGAGGGAVAVLMISVRIWMPPSPPLRGRGAGGEGACIVYPPRPLTPNLSPPKRGRREPDGRVAVV